MLPLMFVEHFDNVSSDSVSKLLNSLINATRFGILGQVTPYRGGGYNYGSPIWADFREHIDANEHLSYYQIFGHSQQSHDPVITDEWACLDCRQSFVLDIDKHNIHSI